MGGVKIDYEEWAARNGVETPLRVALNPDVWLLAPHFEPENAAFIRAALRTAPRLYGNTLIITAGADGKHGPESRHFEGDGWDLRYRGFRTGGIQAGDEEPTQEAAQRIFNSRQKLVAAAWCQRMRNVLGQGYDVVQQKDHIHGERNRNFG
jgi:hypothetical protein